VASRNGLFFWLFATVVRVRYSFLVVAVLLALGGRRSPPEILIWVGAMTAGVLLHEFGHVAAARYHRFSPSVELHGMGGVTRWKTWAPMSWHEQVTTSLAGPAAGFLAGGLVWLALRASGGLPSSPLLWRIATDFLWVSVGWGLLNLLPILPLDGAQAVEGLLSRSGIVHDPARTMRVVSVVTAILIGLLALAAGYWWGALLAGLLAVDNGARLRGAPGSLPSGPAAPWYRPRTRRRPGARRP